MYNFIFYFFFNLVFYIFGFEFFKFNKNLSLLGDYWNNLVYGFIFGIISYKAMNICKNKKEKYNRFLNKLK